jgi:hypothetical protein
MYNILFTLDSRIGTSRPTTTSPFFLNSLPPTSPTSSYDFVIFAPPWMGGVLDIDKPKTLSNLFKLASRPAGHRGGLVPVEDSFQGALEVPQPIPTSFVMFFSSKVYYFSLQRTPRFFLSV